MEKNERLEKVYSQGVLTSMEIWDDTENGSKLSLQTKWKFRWYDCFVR